MTAERWTAEMLYLLAASPHRGRNIMHTFSPSLNRTVILSKSYFSSACSLRASLAAVLHMRPQYSTGVA